MMYTHPDFEELLKLLIECRVFHVTVMQRKRCNRGINRENKFMTR